MNIEKCCSCKLCEIACPKQAISISSDDYGFLYPKINDEMCIHCGLCNKICPANNILHTNVIDCFVGYTQDKIREKESSGGIFSQIAKYVLEQKGIVFGAAFNKDWNVEIIYTDNDITPMLGSKYVQADVKNTYKECKEFLEKNRLVLYTGTPCQIYALKSYLKKDYDNLITIDIFCHGVPSPKVWQMYIKSFNKEIESINFRDKTYGWNNYNFTIKFKDGSIFTENHLHNKYMKLFLENKILRKSCYDCNFRSHAIADISLGDAWGIFSKLNDNKGLSNIIVHTNKGLEIIQNMNIIKEKIDYSIVEKTNCINSKYIIPKERL